ncbi:MAG: hypothetical protein CME40_12370 [Haliea sp.]|nr:hypothetical protein [Haliea sp.]|tara:strand:- start:5471 stop:5689 length:219 start_codon:yes stop_codon:yes gene_type:complete
MRLFRRGYLRTAVLGTVAMGVLVWAAVDRFEVPAERVWEMFQVALLLVGLLVLAAALPAALWVAWRRWRSSR